jgi:hypothetical protein
MPHMMASPSTSFAALHALQHAQGSSSGSGGGHGGYTQAAAPQQVGGDTELSVQGTRDLLLWGGVRESAPSPAFTGRAVQRAGARGCALEGVHLNGLPENPEPSLATPSLP